MSKNDDWDAVVEREKTNPYSSGSLHKNRVTQRC